jgi:hypothetical protein
VNWRVASIVICFALVLVAAVVWMWRDSHWKQEIKNMPEKQDTSWLHDTLTLPPATVTPNPAPAEVDSQATDWHAVDSLQCVVASKEEQIRALLLTRTTQQAWESRSDSASVVGRLRIWFHPGTESFQSKVWIDSLRIREKIIETVKYITIEAKDWNFVSIVGAIAFALGVVFGAFL